MEDDALITILRVLAVTIDVTRFSRQSKSTKFSNNCGQRRNRTADTGIFNPWGFREFV